MSLSKDLRGINFRESALFEDFVGVNLTFAFRNIFSTTLVDGFEKNLSKNQYLFAYTNDKIADGLKKNKFKGVPTKPGPQSGPQIWTPLWTPIWTPSNGVNSFERSNVNIRIDIEYQSGTFLKQVVSCASLS